MSYLLLGFTAANSLLGAGLLQDVNGNKANLDLVALAQKTLDVGNVGVDGKSSLSGQFVGGLCVAAVDLAVLSTARISVDRLLVALVLLVLAGNVARAGNGESGEGEDEDLGVHFDRLLVSCLWSERRIWRGHCGIYRSARVVGVIVVDDGMFKLEGPE